MTEIEEVLVGQDGWLSLYKRRLGQPISDEERFFKAVDTYGIWPLYEAIIITASRKNFAGDPLGYVLTVAHDKWKDDVRKEMDVARYNLMIEEQKERTARENALLAEKIKRARRK